MPSSPAHHTELRAIDLEVGYGPTSVITGLNLDVPTGGFTVIVGPNGCGKSTLLRALGRVLPARSGAVRLDGSALSGFRPAELARRVAFLAQSPLTPGSITVGELVARGRTPHQGLFRQWSRDDERIVSESLSSVGLRDASERLVEELSGGQRQRVWIAVVLAQETPVLLLDEPTTYLDVAHQIEVLDVCSELHRAGRTLVTVLHDLNMAARYASHVVAMRDGAIVTQGTAQDVFTPPILREVFGLDAHVLSDPDNGAPLIVPRDRRAQH
ncbi:MAG: ABC transporter ATP-binding protein [Mycetocola sp.]